MSVPAPRSTWLLDDEGRLRTGYRLSIYLVATAWLVSALQILAVLLFSSFDVSVANPSKQLSLSYLLGLELASVVGITVTTLAARRWLDRRSFASLGLHPQAGWWRDMALGLVLGLVLMACIFGVELGAGWIVWTGRPAVLSLGALGMALILFVVVAWSEELLVRGYILQNATAAWGAFPAILLSSALFSLLHFSNPGADVMSGVGIFVAGVLFAVAFFATRALWLPMALHFSWNFFEGPIFGFLVSGIRLNGLLSTRPVGPELVTGGAFGPESGLSGILAGCLGIVVLYVYGRQRSRMRSVSAAGEPGDRSGL